MSEGVSKKEFTSLCDDVKEIKSALLGNAEFGQKGYRQRLEEVEARAEKLEEFRKKIVYYAAGAAGGATGLVQFIISLI